MPHAPPQHLPGVSSGSFQAPDHEYPSHLLLTVTVTDSGGLTDSRTVQLNPKTVTLTFASSPAGRRSPSRAGPVSPARRSSRAPRSPSRRRPSSSRGPTAALAAWSDGGAPSHEVTAPATARSYIATYDAVMSSLTLQTRRDKLELKIDGTRRKAEWRQTLPVGASVSLIDPRSQVKKGIRYVCVHWKDGGHRKRTVTVTDAPLVLKAVYRRRR